MPTCTDCGLSVPAEGTGSLPRFWTEEARYTADGELIAYAVRCWHCSIKHHQEHKED